MFELSEPKVIEREPYLVVGAYCTFEGEDEAVTKAHIPRRSRDLPGISDSLLVLAAWIADVDP